MENTSPKSIKPVFRPVHRCPGTATFGHDRNLSPGVTRRRFDPAIADPVVVAETTVEIHVGTNMTVFHDVIRSAPLEGQMPDVVDVAVREAGSVSSSKAHVAVATGPLVPGTVDVQARELCSVGILHG